MKRIVLLPALLAALLAIPACTTVENDTANAAPSAPSAPPPSKPKPKPDAVADSSTSSFANTKKASQDRSGITPYPFHTCAVQFHKPFKNGKPKYRRIYKGQEVLLCCTPCMKAFDMNPEPYMPRIYAEVERKGLQPGDPSRY